eukprot:5717845-Amphidinium_carterae.1
MKRTIQEHHNVPTYDKPPGWTYVAPGGHQPTLQKELEYEVKRMPLKGNRTLWLIFDMVAELA